MARSALATKTLPLTHILLVEDNPSDAFLIESLLEDDASTLYEIYCVKTQSAAMEILANQTFDVCLLDLSLPDANGFSAMINIQDGAPDLPVLILTGTNDMTLAKRAVGRGAQDYLLKDEMEAAGLARAIDYAIERKRLEKELFQRANHDALTGLANREAFMSRLNIALERAERSDVGVTVLFIDLDHFKPINDTLSHDAGDEALKTVAQRIKESLRAYDMPARMGGDEFAVLLEGIGNARDAAHIAQKMVKMLAEPMHYQNALLNIGASIGVASSEPTMRAETLLQNADTAMYHAKKEGGNAYRFYAESMYDETVARLNLEEDLRTALEADELQIYYQPYVNTCDGTIIGVEALLRWMHPERGLLSADAFLPAAEAARLMPQIGAWKCRQLKRDIAMWNAYALPPLAIAMNFSAMQLDAPDLIEWFVPLTSKEFLGLHHLVVEIPETAITQITGARFMAIAKLHELDIGLHLDHFGCCALPLLTLDSLPFSMLKIDISLIQNMSEEVTSDLLVSAAIMLSHHMGIKIGAVGVEAPWQAAMLKSQTCDVIQGFLTGRPMTAEQLVKWVENKTDRDFSV